LRRRARCGRALAAWPVAYHGSITIPLRCRFDHQGR
jgi:hypothetical protein